jgi:hypothetical protein
MPMKKTYEQLRHIHALLRQSGIDKEGKEDMVMSITGGRAKSCAELEYQEAAQMVRLLQANATPKAFQVNPLLDKKRKKVLSMFHEMGYCKPGTRRLDMDRVQAIIVKYGFKHCELNNYTLEELSKLIEQIKKMRDHFLKSSYRTLQNQQR